MPEWKIIQSDVIDSRQRAQALLEQWNRFRLGRSCSHVLHFQEIKDRLENLATIITAEMYCSPTEQLLEEHCATFEKELDKFREKVFQDLLTGIQTK